MGSVAGAVVVVVRGPRSRGQGRKRERVACDQNVSVQKATFGGPDGASGSRLDTGRRPLQGSLVSEGHSRVRPRPVSVPLGNRHTGRGGEDRSAMTIPPSDHNAAARLP